MMLLFILITFSLLNTGDGFCYKSICKSNKGVPGCRNLIAGLKDLDDDACCRNPDAVGHTVITQGLGGGCYRCDKCKDVLTKRNGGWSAWSPWSRCTVTCGGGFTTSQRECNNPPPSELGKQCEGDPSITETCGNKPCPINGGWGQWSSWSTCTKSCGKGIVDRVRRCTEPPPQHGGLECPGQDIERKECIKIRNCPVDGGWSNWSPWARCSKTCTKGETDRRRTCTKPAPDHGGKDCRGDDFQRKECVMAEKCPIHGGWSPWSKWVDCSKTCGTGVTQRRRICNNPRPQFNGTSCAGKDSAKKDCVKIKNCPIDGGWGSWGKWSQCDVTCGGGELLRRRECDNPRPKFNGKKCSGNGVERKPCNEDPCPVHGGWSEWSEWGSCIFADCNNTRDGGLQTRSRSCTNPTPAIGGKMCLGKMFDSGFCAERDNCARDGGWSLWGPWFCSNTGANRLRKCDNPEPAQGGKFCEGKANEWLRKSDDEKKFCQACRDWCNKSRLTTPKYATTSRSDMEETASGSGSGNGDEEGGSDDGGEEGGSSNDAKD